MISDHDITACFSGKYKIKRMRNRNVNIIGNSFYRHRHLNRRLNNIAMRRNRRDFIADRLAAEIRIAPQSSSLKLTSFLEARIRSTIIHRIKPHY